MIDFKEKERYNMADLVQIVALLRDPEGGCPWDIRQTHQSIRQNMIEETYEVVEAIDLKDTTLLQEELGDVLLQVVFHSQMEAEAGSFDFDSVCDGICKKLVYRHPHVFGNVSVSDSTQALESWEKMKNQEKGRKTAAHRLESVPACLPALMKAAKTQKRAAEFGFAPKDQNEAVAMLANSVQLLQNQPEDPQQAIGRVLFAAVAAARAMGTEPEEALDRATGQFRARVEACESAAQADGSLLQQLDRKELAEYWGREL